MRTQTITRILTLLLAASLWPVAALHADEDAAPSAVTTVSHTGEAARAAASAASDAADAAADAADEAAKQADEAADKAKARAEELRERAEKQADEALEHLDSQLPHWQRFSHHWSVNNDDGHAVVSIAHDATLAANEKSDAVVAILGSASSAGEVADSVVAVLGDAHVTGPVDNGDVVAVLGTAFVDSKVAGDVVSVLGHVELGPHADVGGQIVSVGGGVVRDPAAIVGHGVQNVALGSEWASPVWLRTWIRHCVVYGRLLAFDPALGWAWTIGLAILALSVLMAIVFRPATERCLSTLEAHPGPCILTGVLTGIATPFLTFALVVTVLGIFAIPFFWLGLMIAKLFGKMVILAWLGRRVTGKASNEGLRHVGLAVLIGGLFVLFLYTIPVFGFLVYMAMNIVGLGVAVYTMLLAVRARSEARQAAPLRASEPIDAAAQAQPEASADQTTGAEASLGSAPAMAAPLAGGSISDPRAGFWPRMGALLIDVILMAAVTHLITHSDDLSLLLLAAYGAIMWKLRGTTVGGIVFNLHVVRVDGRELDWSTVVVRALSCFLSLFAIGLGFLWIAFDDQRQAWHDKIAGTVVVRTRARSLV